MVFNAISCSRIFDQGISDNEEKSSFYNEQLIYTTSICCRFVSSLRNTATRLDSSGPSFAHISSCRYRRSRQKSIESRLIQFSCSVILRVTPFFFGVIITRMQVYGVVHCRLAVGSQGVRRLRSAHTVPVEACRRHPDVV